MNKLLHRLSISRLYAQKLKPERNRLNLLGHCYRLQVSGIVNVDVIVFVHRDYVQRDQLKGITIIPGSRAIRLAH